MNRKNYRFNLLRQMAECDANYIRLLKLVPQLNAYLHNSSLDANLVREIANGCSDARLGSLERPEKTLEGLVSEFVIADYEDIGPVTVKIKILEAFKYTTTVQITQHPELKKWMTNPSMLVRLYHDANTAEVLSYQGHRNFKPHYPQPNPQMYQANEKLHVNTFLGEWLTHCLRVGRCTTASLAELI
ncbi:MAG: DUF1249 domain-containing protein [Pseudohongiellaceae bacterium]